MLNTCDPDVIVANEKTPTTIGVAHIREKYTPRMKAATFKSSFEPQHIAIYDNFAVVIGNFDVQATDKITKEVGGGSGLLALGYHRHDDGSWEMVFDMDNNA